MTKQYQTWNYKSLEVFYYPELEGDGTNQAASFVRFIKEYFPGKQFDRIFEWCAGPGFIGFSLLKEGIGKSLCLADINPAAIECIKKTIQENKLHGFVDYYLSDNLKSIPKSEKFDLIVGNPPNYFALNPKNMAAQKLQEDLRPNDKGWKIHKEFYNEIAKYLNQDAYLLITEVEPYEKIVFNSTSDSIPYDIREEVPLKDFKKMIADGGLQYVGAKHFHSAFDRMYNEGAISKEIIHKLYLIISKKGSSN